MKFTSITKWEFKNTLKSKKFMMIFFLQLSVLFLMIIIFNSFVTNIESDNGISITPSLNGFASMDVLDQSGIITKSINPVITVIPLSYNSSLNNIAAGKTTGFLYVPGNVDQKIRLGQTIDMTVYLDSSDPKSSVVKDEVNSTAQIISQSYSNTLSASAVPQNTTTPTVNQESTGESLPLQIITKVMLVILLFLPLLLFGNMIIDTIVGEKERKTGEILIAMPISQAQIIIGKSMAVVLTISLQVAMWIIILLIAGFHIDNPILVFIFIFLTSIPIIGITSIVAAYSKNFKEAGIGLSIAYMGIVGFLIVPVLIYLSRKSFIANISPMTIVMRLFSGESISAADYGISLATILIVSLISYWISIKLFERDDIIFGPRPGILRLIYDLITFKKF
ncbi:MAG: ABC transporter permease [Methanobacterium sp.]|uniref:ABC transporter permease n=1 Tax=Methanobacterium sp. TaxID=2164 RepID=UPI003C76705B